MDPTSWSAYSQHFSRLGASMNHPPGALAQSAQINDLALSSSLPRQEHIPGYGNTGGPHHFLLAASHGLNPPQPSNHNDPSFNANLFAANYDASLFGGSFQSNKGHLSSFSQGPGLFKAVSRESDFNDLRTGFSHCGMSPYARNPEANASLPGGGGLGSGPLFPNSMPPGSWRHSGMIPPSCGPFGVLPHETVLQRSHHLSRGGDKLSVQSAKQSRSSHPNNSYVEQDLSRGYRSILTSPARPPSSYVDSSNTSHSSLLSPQGDPYFSSVSDNYYSSCSKNDFAAYSSYCTNVQPPVQRSAISPYCYPQTFGAFDPNIEKQDAATSNPNASANSNFSNFVPNNSLNSNPTHMHNGQISRQSVITSNVTNNSVIYNSESHHQSHPYNHRETYPYPVSSHAASCQPAHSSNSNSSGSSSGRHVGAHLSNNHHSTGQPAYPPMSTPIPASTPAHPTPPSSIGQAYIPTPLPLSHDSGCSSVNSQSVMYNSPSNDGCYSTPGTCHSESGSPAKHDGSHHSSPSMYSVDNSNLSVNSGEPFVDPNRMHPHPNSEGNYVNNTLINEANASDVQDGTSNSAAKHLDGNMPGIDSSLMSSGCSSQPKNIQIPPMLPIDMAKVSKANNFQNVSMDPASENVQMNVRNSDQDKNNDSLTSEPKCLMTKSDVFSFSAESPPALDCTQKVKQKGKQGRKRKNSSPCMTPVPLNCTYAHLENTPHHLSPHDTQQVEENLSVNNNSEPFYKKSPTSYNALQPIPSSSSPVDLSHVSLNLSVKKQESTEEKEKIVSPQDNQSSSYETSTMSSNQWADSQDGNNAEDKKVQEAENNQKENESDVKRETKDETICQMTPMDDLSDESKKLCNSIEDDLGFLAELSSDPDVEDSTSKSSFPGKNRKKNQGFLQSFLTFLEGREEPGGSNSASDVAKDDKSQKSETSGSKVKESDVIKKSETSSDVDQKKDETKKELIEDNDDKDNFDEAPSLDPALFGCSTLQKEMVVPNPEAPSFSSDEDENSAQGIFDSVAMAIQRLCEDNEEDHNDKNEKTDNASSSKSKDEMPVLTSINEADAASKGEGKEDECTIKTACVVKTKRGKRKRTRHLLVIKVKRTEKNPVISKTFQATTKTRRTRNGAKASDSVRNVKSQRRPLMRKCKEKETKKRNTNRVKRKPRNSVKRKYALNEVADVKPECTTAPEVINENEVDMQPVEEKEPTVRITLIPPVPDILPKKQKKLNKTRQKRRRRGHHHHKKVEVAPVVEEKPPEPPTITIDDDDANNLCNDECLEMKVHEKCSSNGENNWNTETHFKTGDFVISIESKNNENPPIWRIEGKNVLQLFEAIEEEKMKPLYRNTSSYSRWSPSSKHKYSKQPVKIIKSDDDTVIVELIKSENTDRKEMTGSCDYTVHPQRENFEVYLQTLVSHALDPDFIPEILKENDEYFLSHLQAIEKINFEKKGTLLQCDEWDSQLLDSVKMYPYVSVSMSKEDEKSLCQVCNNNKIQFMVHFHGQLYDPTTLESKAEGKHHPVCDFNFPLCGSCVQVVTLYSRLHHHKYHFFQLGCKKVKDVKRGEEKNSHAILEECLQDTEWMAQMFQDMLEMWNACDRYR